MATRQTTVQLARWKGGTHPTLSNITRLMQEKGLRPYKWDTTPNQRYAVRSHNYAKLLYVVEGSLEITLPDENQRLKLRAGDRLEIPARVRHGSVTGRKGATCLEAAIRR
jgi:quercetin dioxygenase-like cupin family protein